MLTRKRRFRTSIGGYVDYDSYGIVGFTDLVSNTVVLDDISPLSRTSEILACNLDLGFLPGIAHEAAHHACLDSRVGLALCSLWQSSLSLWWEQLGSDIPQQPARDLAVAYAANTLLQPLLEGVALFAEHDLVTGDSPVLSRVTQRVSALFSRGRIASMFSGDRDRLRSLAAENRDGVFSAGHTTVLRLARSTDQWMERKRLLLSQPLKAPNRYLLGYLAVKGMYAALISKCPEFADPELFFVAVVHHFLHDEPLADILLRLRNKQVDPQEAYLALGNDLSAFLARFQDLFDDLFANPVRVAQRAAESVLRPPNANQLVSERDMFMRLRTVGTMNVMWPHLMHHRQEFRFSFQPVVIRLARNGEATILDSGSNQEICRVMAVEGARLADGEEHAGGREFEGSIEAVQLSDLKTFVICILGHDGLVAVFDCLTGEWNPKHLVELLDDMPSALAVEGAMHAFTHWQSMARHRGDVREALEFYEQQSRDAVDHLYPQLICRGSMANLQERVVEAFDARGVFSIYRPEDEAHVARLSLAAGLFSSLEDAAKQLKVDDNEVRRLAVRFNETSERACGFAPLA